jgi:hypothetical protein
MVQALKTPLMVGLARRIYNPRRDEDPERQQIEAMRDVLAWLAVRPSAATPTAAAGTATNADTGIRTGRSGDALPATPTPDRPGRPRSPDDRTRQSRRYPPAVRAQAVGLVGAGEPPREVAVRLAWTGGGAPLGPGRPGASAAAAGLPRTPNPWPTEVDEDQPDEG